jgi:hypothetical protein
MIGRWKKIFSSSLCPLLLMRQNQQPQFTQHPPPQIVYVQPPPQQVIYYQPPQVQVQIQAPPPSSHPITTEFTSGYLSFTSFCRGLNVAISLGFLLFGFTLCSKFLGNESDLASKRPIKGKKSLFLVLFIYFVFLLIGLGIIPGLVDWAPVLVYLYLGQRKKILILFVLRFFYIVGLVPQIVVLAVLAGAITGGLATIVSVVFEVLWFVIMFVQVKGCLFDQISLVRALNRGEEIMDTEFAGQTGMMLVTFGMINHKYSCTMVSGQRTTLCVTKH